jgi:hypothetical protein
MQGCSLRLFQNILRPQLKRKSKNSVKSSIMVIKIILIEWFMSGTRYLMNHFRKLIILFEVKLECIFYVFSLN